MLCSHGSFQQAIFPALAGLRKEGSLDNGMVTLEMDKTPNLMLGTWEG